jgi:hypothetical protein
MPMPSSAGSTEARQRPGLRFTQRSYAGNAKADRTPAGSWSNSKGALRAYCPYGASAMSRRISSGWRRR